MEWAVILSHIASFTIGIVVGAVLSAFLSVPARADLEQENWRLRQLLKTKDDPYGDHVLERATRYV
jgi:hypothetical protein